MTRLFTDGAEMGSTLGIKPDPTVWKVNNSIKRSGAYSYMESGASCWIATAVNNLAEVYARFAFYPGTYQSDYSHYFFQIYNSGQLLLSLAPLNNSNWKIGVYKNTTLLGNGNAAMTTNTWHLIEVYYKIHSSLGVIQVRVNGVLDYSYTGDTTVSTSTTFNSVNIGCSYGNYCVWYFDDIAINDTNGNIDNSWCGDGHIIALTPNANGDSSDFVGSDGNSVDNYLLVDEVPSDGDTSYVESSTQNDCDLYGLTACGIDSELYNISRIWVETEAKDTTTGSGIIAHVIKTSGSEISSNNCELTTSYSSQKSEQYPINPMTGLPWTPTDLDNLQAGVKIVQ